MSNQPNHQKSTKFYPTKNEKNITYCKELWFIVFFQCIHNSLLSSQDLFQILIAVTVIEIRFGDLAIKLFLSV